IALGDTTDTAAHYAHLYFIVTKTAKRTLQRFQRATNVRFEDDVKRLLLFLAHVLEDVFQLACVSTRQFNFTELALTEQSHFTGFLLVSNNSHVIASFWRTVETEDLNRNRWTRFFDRLAVL